MNLTLKSFVRTILQHKSLQSFYKHMEIFLKPSGVTQPQCSMTEYLFLEEEIKRIAMNFTTLTLTHTNGVCLIATSPLCLEEDTLLLSLEDTFLLLVDSMGHSITISIILTFILLRSQKLLPHMLLIYQRW